VERGLREVVFCSMAMAGGYAVYIVHSALSMRQGTAVHKLKALYITPLPFAYKNVSKASDDFPEPESR
jgi:hypothetical protein